MNFKVLTAAVHVPEQTVQLELSVEEFALISALVYGRLGGSSDARSSVEKCLNDAGNSLHPHWGYKVARALDRHNSPHLAAGVAELFA